MISISELLSRHKNQEIINQYNKLYETKSSIDNNLINELKKADFSYDNPHILHFYSNSDKSINFVKLSLEYPDSITNLDNDSQNDIIGLYVEPHVISHFGELELLSHIIHIILSKIHNKNLPKI